jgi:hypothetical protein
MAIWNEIYGFEPSYMNRNYLERLKIKLMNVKSMESELQKVIIKHINIGSVFNWY